MLKWIKEILILVVFIVVILLILGITRIFGAKPGVFSQDLKAIVIGIPVMLALVGIGALLRRLWKYTAVKVIAVIAIAILIICLILF